MARSNPRPRHKAATEVTIVTDEKSTFAQTVDTYWRPVALVVLIAAGWVLYGEYSEKQVGEARNAEWNILVKASNTGDPQSLLKAARTELVGTGLEGWAALAAVPPFLEERDYDGAMEALSAIEASGAPLLTNLSLPIGKDGAEGTIASTLKTTLASQVAQDRALRAIFENTLPPEGSPVVELVVSLGGETRSIALALYAEQAPKHVENFLKLVREGYYDGTKFHRIIEGFMIQGGDPNTKDPAKGVETWGQGGPEYKIESETGDLVHARYVLSAAKNPNELQSSGSQFFITTGTPHHLDGIHTVFGAVIEGQTAVDELNRVPTRPNQGQQRDIPEAPVPAIASARVRGE
jgi:cyclophilin family peptidyl-prolyl cis-trans isomerase